MRRISLIIVLLMLQSFSGCMSKSYSEIEQLSNNCKNKTEGGVVISFDDSQNIPKWGEHRDFFKSHQVKATFFVDRWAGLDESELDILRNLSQDGHEIAFHSTNHEDYFEFLNEGKNASDYLDAAILPGLEDMEDRGFSATSFAYPRGHRDTEIDGLLLEHFDVLRGTQSNKVGSESWMAECEDLRVFRSFPIITTTENESSLEYREYWTNHGMNYSKRGNVTLLFNGHSIVDGYGAASLEYLELFFNQINDLGLPYLLMSDLGK
jgi:peptidoglycan/xylan/chitin deacetylase (PgdA/CDA1 family)